MKRSASYLCLLTQVPKKPRIKMEKKVKEEEAERETFVCRSCGKEIAREDDLLSRLELHLPCGIFRAATNVIDIVNSASDPGCANFYGHVHCSHCFTLLGASLLNVPPPEFHDYGVYWVTENYMMIMSKLRIKRENLLLDAVTRAVVGVMNPHVQRGGRALRCFFRVVGDQRCSDRI